MRLRAKSRFCFKCHLSKASTTTGWTSSWKFDPATGLRLGTPLRRNIGCGKMTVSGVSGFLFHEPRSQEAATHLVQVEATPSSNEPDPDIVLESGTLQVTMSS